MPNRILREGILTSERINELSPEAELFYRRLMSVVDDFGRIEAHPAILRAKCFPMKLDTVSEADVSRWLTECAQMSAACSRNGSQPLVILYRDINDNVNDTGKQYLQVSDFKQRTRTDSKCPEPPPSQCSRNDGHSARLGVGVGVGGDEGVDNTHVQNDTMSDVKTCQDSLNLTPSEDSEGPSWKDRKFQEFWAVVWWKKAKGAAEESFKRQAVKVSVANQIIAAAKEQGPELLAEAQRRHSTAIHPSTWLNQKRYLDEQVKQPGTERARDDTSYLKGLGTP
jgi:hypothetical protein